MKTIWSDVHKNFHLISCLCVLALWFPGCEGHRKMGRTSMGDRLMGRNQVSLRPRNFARHDNRRCILGPNNPLNPAHFKPQPPKYTGKWNVANGLHESKAKKDAKKEQGEIVRKLKEDVKADPARQDELDKALAKLKELKTDPMSALKKPKQTKKVPHNPTKEQMKEAKEIKAREKKVWLESLQKDEEKAWLETLQEDEKYIGRGILAQAVLGRVRALQAAQRFGKSPSQISRKMRKIWKPKSSPVQDMQDGSKQAVVAA